MNISIIGMPLFYGCDKPGVEKGPEDVYKRQAEAVHQIALVVKSKSSENSRYSSFFVFLHFSFLTFIFL